MNSFFLQYRKHLAYGFSARLEYCNFIYILTHIACRFSNFICQVFAIVRQFFLGNYST